jgi:hypothetical protein
VQCYADGKKKKVIEKQRRKEKDFERRT